MKNNICKSFALIRFISNVTYLTNYWGIIIIFWWVGGEKSVFSASVFEYLKKFFFAGSVKSAYDVYEAS